MPPRLSRTTLQPSHNATSKPRPSVTRPSKRPRRALNAYAIAAAQDPTADRAKVRQHRLGEAEDDEPRRKKLRLLDADEEPDEPKASEGRRRRDKAVRKGGALGGSHEDEGSDEGSDSEGNEWRMGDVADDEDSDVDSDEAFGDSDEERFDGFAFRGSSGLGSAAKKKKRREEEVEAEVNLDEGGELDEEDDLGEDAVDLADMLDQGEGESSDQESERDKEQNVSMDAGTRKKDTAFKIGGEDFDEEDFGGFGGSDSEEYDGRLVSPAESPEAEDDGARSTVSSSDEGDDDSGPENIQRLQEMVSSLPKAKATEASSGGQEGRASQKPTAARLLASLKQMPGLDPSLSRSVKKLSENLESSTKEKPTGLVKVPLPKRQQDRLDREAAYDKAKETLNRWLDTVKHNRRSEHLSFPLRDPEAQEAQGTSRMLPTSMDKPQTELEGTIQTILQESGLKGKGGPEDEEKMRKEEELETNKMPYEEVMARRAELRKARELLYREEVRAKRIKKIKSKAYRRVHRKEREKAQQRDMDMMVAAGLELPEAEKEKNDRRRAEERMGARHRESKWAKSAKKAGRTVWDEDVRDGVTDMARRNEELRQRMEGKESNQDDDMASDASDGSSEDEQDDDSAQFKLREDLDKVSKDPMADTMTSKLASMKFMQQADANLRKENDEEIARLRREMDGEESAEEFEEDHNLGRRVFGPVKTTTIQQSRPAKQRNELEEPQDSADESVDGEHLEQTNAQEQNFKMLSSTPSKDVEKKPKQRLNPPSVARPYKEASQIMTAPPDEDGMHLKQEHNKTHKSNAGPDTTGWTKVEYKARTDGNSDEGASKLDNENQAEDPLIPSNIDLVRAAFGVDDDAEAQFNAEKADAAESEDEQFTDNALPGWGSWMGEGISKRAQKRTQQRNAGRFVTKTQGGVKAADRKDAKLDRVVISEKRSKKNGKYLSSALPHPFENRQQYERSLRIPVGPEWTTKETFQNSTKPRVMVKQGIIRPMEKPLV